MGSEPQGVLNISLRHLKPDLKEPPFYIICPGPGETQTNIERQYYDAQVHDIRGKEQHFSLDKNGFQFVRHTISEESIDTIRAEENEFVLRKYYPEVEELVKGVTGAERVVAFDHNIRKRVLHPGKNKEVTQPADSVHVDQ